MTGVIGKARRYGRLVQPHSKRMVCVALDHGMQVGPIDGIEDLDSAIAVCVDAGVDAVILNPGGFLRHAGRLAGSGPAVILRLDQTTMWRTGSPFGYGGAHNRLVGTVEEAVAMGAEAVITYLFMLSKDPLQESRSLEITAEIGEAARQWGIVHVVEAMATFDGLVDRDEAATVAFCSRVAGEMGADLVKTNWTGGTDSFAPIARQSLCPVVVAGGPRLGGDEAVVAYAEDVVRSGAAGVIFGRNIFQSANPAALLHRLRMVVHSAPA